MKGKASLNTFILDHPPHRLQGVHFDMIDFFAPVAMSVGLPP